MCLLLEIYICLDNSFSCFQRNCFDLILKYCNFVPQICGTVLTYAVITIQLKPTAIDPGSTFATNDDITNVTSPNVLQSALP